MAKKDGEYTRILLTDTLKKCHHRKDMIWPCKHWYSLICIPELMLMSVKVLTICWSRHFVSIPKLVSILLLSYSHIGKVCVPFDPERVDKFDVNDVPNLTSVINDLGTSSSLQTMEGALMVFKNFLRKIDKEYVDDVRKSKKGG